MLDHWDYEFTAWPDEQSQRWNSSARTWFSWMRTRVTMTFTEREFNDFREEMFKVGLTLREIERVPHHEPETVL